MNHSAYRASPMLCACLREFIMLDDLRGLLYCIPIRYFCYHLAHHFLRLLATQTSVYVHVYCFLL